MPRKKVEKKIIKDLVFPTVRDVLKIAGACTLIGGVMLIPATATIITPILQFTRKKMDEHEEIKNHKFDKARLWLQLRRLEKQKVIQLIPHPDGNIEIKLTDFGKTKYLHFNLEESIRKFNKTTWDGKWRLIIFDVSEENRSGRNRFRLFLKNLKFYQLQKSVWLSPYPCESEIEYLRTYHDLENVQIITTGKIENDHAYKLYFGLA